MRKLVNTREKEDAIREVIEKLDQRIAEKGDHCFVSCHEILGVVTEEMDELKEAVRHCDSREVYDELLDVAVASIWGLASYKAGGVEW